MINIKGEKLKVVLNSIKEQHIDISIKDRSGKLSQYYHIEDVKDVELSDANLSLVVLRLPECCSCVIVHLNSIYGLKLNKYLNLNGRLVDALTVVRADLEPVLQH